jgi:hypothetical protein
MEPVYCQKSQMICRIGRYNASSSSSSSSSMSHKIQGFHLFILFFLDAWLYDYWLHGLGVGHVSHRQQIYRWISGKYEQHILKRPLILINFSAPRYSHMWSLVLDSLCFSPA